MAIRILSTGWNLIEPDGQPVIIRHPGGVGSLDLTFAAFEPPLDATDIDVWMVHEGDGVVVYGHHTGLALWAGTDTAGLTIEVLSEISAKPGHRLNLIEPRPGSVSTAPPSAPLAVGTIPDQIDFVVMQ